VILQNGAACGNVYWWAAEAVTMTDSNLVGTVLAGAATTFTNGTSSGEALAKAGITLTGTAAVNACAPGGSGGDAGSPPPVCRANDFVTGGGWIDPAPSGAKATFAVSGGIKKGEFWGHLTYEDHGKKGVSIKSESVTAYTVIDATTRRIEGAASVDGKKGFTYQADVSDNGEPGRKDRFTLRLSSGYGASGLLQGGNIQLHRGHDRACNGDDDEDEDDHGDHEDHGDKGDHGHGKGDHR
jgi:hypothetical protein